MGLRSCSLKRICLEQVEIGCSSPSEIEWWTHNSCWPSAFAVPLQDACSWQWNHPSELRHPYRWIMVWTEGEQGCYDVAFARFNILRRAGAEWGPVIQHALAELHFPHRARVDEVKSVGRTDWLSSCADLILDYLFPLSFGWYQVKASWNPARRFWLESLPLPSPSSSSSSPQLCRPGPSLDLLRVRDQPWKEVLGCVWVLRVCRRFHNDGLQLGFGDSWDWKELLLDSRPYMLCLPCGSTDQVDLEELTMSHAHTHSLAIERFLARGLKRKTFSGVWCAHCRRSLAACPGMLRSAGETETLQAHFVNTHRIDPGGQMFVRVDGRASIDWKGWPRANFDAANDFACV